MSRQTLERLAVPDAWYEKNPAEIAKLALLWGLWAGAVAGIAAMCARGGAWIAGAAALGVLAGSLVVTGIGFIGHDVCHGSVVEGETATRVMAFFSLTLALFLPYFAWVRWHNAFHHRYANTLKDSDRLLRETERQSGLVNYPLYAFANGIGLSLQYVGLRMWRILYGRKGLADAKKRSDVIALLLAVAFYASWAALLPGLVFVLGVVVPLLAGAMTASFYIQSNHFLRPQSKDVDIIGSSMDVDVPGVVDFLHSNFSAHTAHHLYPTVPSKHYPAIRGMIEKTFPERYRAMSFARALWMNLTLPKVIRDGKYLVDRKGRIRLELT